jgi:hypothetical protein
MALVAASAFIHSAASVDAIDSVDKAKGGAKQIPKSLFRANGRDITAHNRRFASESGSIAKNVALASGSSKRYYVRTPEKHTLNFTYLPGPSSMTIDGREGRDFLYSLATLDKNVLVEHLPDYTSDQSDFDYTSKMSRVVSYNESLLRRDENNGCYYYDVSITFEGL